MTDNDMIRRGDARAAIQLGDTITKMQARIASIPAVDADPVCTDCGGSGITYQTERRCACQTSIPAVQPTVKPLVWGDIHQGIYYEARVIGILYSVRLGSDGVARWQAGHMWPWHEAASIEAAKAAAQADYEARILSALDMQPTVSPEQPAATTDVAALVETLDRTTSLGQRSEYSRVGHHLNEASWHVHLAGFKCRGDAEAFLTAALARVKGAM